MELIWFRLCRAVRIVPCSVQVTLKCLSDNRRLQDIKINKNNQKLFDIFFKKGGQSKDTHLAVCVGPEMSWRPVRGRTPPLAPRLQPRPRHPHQGNAVRNGWTGVFLNDGGYAQLAQAPTPHRPGPLSALSATFRHVPGKVVRASKPAAADGARKGLLPCVS